MAAVTPTDTKKMGAQNHGTAGTSKNYDLTNSQGSDLASDHWDLACKLHVVPWPLGRATRKLHGAPGGSRTGEREREEERLGMARNGLLNQSPQPEICVKKD